MFDKLVSEYASVTQVLFKDLAFILPFNQYFITLYVKEQFGIDACVAFLTRNLIPVELL